MDNQLQLSKEGPTNNELELIGIELAVTPNHNREVELEMIGIKRTIPNDPWARNDARITIHTSNGDVTVRFPLQPGNYVAYR